jgi:hypothetical protein
VGMIRDLLTLTMFALLVAAGSLLLAAWWMR